MLNTYYTSQEKSKPTGVHKMSNTVVNHEDMTFTGYWHFSPDFQTAPTLYFLWVGGGYSKTGAYSWHGDTSTADHILPTVLIREIGIV